MTTNTIAPQVQYIEDGSSTIHAIPFKFLANSDVVVMRTIASVPVTLVLGTDYTLSGAGADGGGTVIKASGGTAGATLVIYRASSRAQGFDYTPGDTFPAESHETALDRQSLVNQEQDVDIARALKVPRGTVPPTVGVIGEGEVLQRVGDELTGITIDDFSGPAAAWATALMVYTFGYIGTDSAIPAGVDPGEGFVFTTGSRVFGALNTAGVTDVKFEILTQAALDPQLAVLQAAIVASAGDVITTVATRTAMAGLSTTTPVFLTEAERQGWFRWDPSNLSAKVTLDPRQGIYVAPTVAPTGASGAWVRVWDGVWAKPEWFRNSGDADWRLAFDRVMALCSNMLLGERDYYITSTWVVNTSYFTVEGPRHTDGYSSGYGARVISTDMANDVIRVAPPGAAPVSTSGCLRNVTLRQVCAMHDGTRTVPTLGNELDAVVCFDLSYCIEGRFEYLYANEPLIGFRYTGLVGCYLKHNRAFRSALFGGADFFMGHVTSGVPLLGLIGQNASLYSSDCLANCEGPARAISAARRWGFLCQNAITDQFHHNFETTGCFLAIEGPGIADTGLGNRDFYFEHPKIDQMDGVSILISKLNRDACVRIIEPYVGAQITAPYLMRALDCAGTVQISGGDIYGTPTPNQTIGLAVDNCTGMVSAKGLVMHEVGRPVGINNSDGLDIDVVVQCWSNSSPTYQAMIFAVGSTRGTLRVAAYGAAASYPKAIELDNTCDDLVLNATAADPACISGGVRIAINAINITAPGAYTPAGAAGTAGTGIIVEGITA